MTLEEAKALKVANILCKSSLLNHTCFMFKHLNKTKFVVNDHHELICDTLEYVLNGKLIKVIINIAPRYSKTELAVVNFVSHAFSLNATARFIHLSYSYELAVNTNSEGIKTQMKSDAYMQMFPNVRIKPRSDSKKRWSTTEGGVFYATSTGGQVTGMGAGKVDDPDKVQILTPDQIDQLTVEELEAYELRLFTAGIDKAFDEVATEFDKLKDKEGFNGAMIIDDPIKPEDADSTAKRTRINERWDSTLKNRVNSRRTPIILIGQRTHEDDLSGHIMKNEGYTTDLAEALANPSLWYVLSLPAIVDEGLTTERALWPFKHTLPELKKMQADEPISFGRQYQQNPMPKEGFMYGIFRTYQNLESIPLTQRRLKKNYTDTADKGTDFLSSGCYIETDTAMYVTDILYTAAPMKETKPQTAVMLAKQKTDLCRIESNNGGEGFSEDVENQTRVIRNINTTFITFHQSNNKQVRIFTNSNRVNNLIYMPWNWATLWPEFYKAVTTYLKSGKNPHDDAPDMLTGMVEFFGEDTMETIDPRQLGGFM